MVGIAVMTRAGAEKDEGGSNVLIEHGREQSSRRMRETGDQQLLPGISDDITIDVIAPKLPWIVCQMLWSVSHAWQRVIRSREIYHARVRSKSTQAFVVTKHKLVNRIRSIALYDDSNGSCYNLHPIPGLEEGIPWSCKCITLDYKLYVLGGSSKGYSDPASAAVYVLDLAGGRQWTQCASMRERRRAFGCGVMYGKIYVFGGISELEVVWGCEVYDPKANAWSPIAPIKTFGFHPRTATVGEEFFVHNKGCIGMWPHCPPMAEVYHPLKDEWRSSQHFAKHYERALLMMDGKLHKLTMSSIFVYDDSKKSWEHLRSFSLDVFGPRNYYLKVDVLAAVVVNDEILATMQCKSHGVQTLGVRNPPDINETCLVKSQGLGCADKQIVWKRKPCSLSFENLYTQFLYLVEL